MESRVPTTTPATFIGLLCLKKRSNKKKTWWERLPKGDRFESPTHTQIPILAKSFHFVMFYEIGAF